MKHPISHYIQYLAARSVFFVLSLLPRAWCGLIGALIGQLIYYIGIRVSVTKSNLAASFPGIRPRALDAAVRRVYRHFGRVATSFSWLSKRSGEDVPDWLAISGRELLVDTLQYGKGAIVISGHLGNWEMMGTAVAKLGFPVTFVVTTQTNKLIEQYMDRIRTKCGVEIVKRKDAVKGVLSALKRNRLVAILIDQDAHEDGVFVPFFGRPASTPRGPAVFHLRTGAPLVFAQSLHVGHEKYRIRLSPVNTQGMTDPDAITARLSELLEQAVRESPEQWFWMHRRWKTRPSVS